MREVMSLDGVSIFINSFVASVVYSLPSKLAAGDSASTKTLDKASKPKVMNCSGYISYDNYKNLESLLRLADAKDGEGKRVAYDVISDSAEVMGIRRVKFFDQFVASEQATKRKWKVSFSLREVDSVEEIKEQRQATKAATVATGEASQSVESPTNEAAANATAPAQLTQFEQMLSKVDEFIGGLSNDSV